MKLLPKSVLLNRIISVVLITLCFLHIIWLDIALLKIGIRFSVNAKGQDILFYKVAFWKLIFFLSYTTSVYVLVVWAILKNKPLPLLGACIFFLFQVIHSLNLLFGAYFTGLEFLSVMFVLGLFLANTGIVFSLVRMINNLNHPKIDLDLFKKREIQTTTRNLHLFIVIFLVLGFPYLYDLVNHLFSVYNQSGYRFYTNNFIYLVILISYLIGIVFGNRFIYLTFAAIMVFVISEFHEFIFNVIFSIINHPKVDNNSELFSYTFKIIYKILAYAILMSIVVAAITKLKHYFYSSKEENAIILDSEFGTTDRNH